MECFITLNLKLFGRKHKFLNKLKILRNALSTFEKHNKKQNVQHIPVMLTEVTELFQKLQPKAILDLTFGGGGHSRHLLNSLPSLQHLYTLDRDPQAYQEACLLSKEDTRVKPIVGKFSQVVQLMTESHEPLSLDGCLLDAGLSSIQLADAARGFSLSRDGPLDMRMDPSSNDPDQITAHDVVNYMSEEKLSYIIKRYGEDKMAKQIAKVIVDHRNLYGCINTTSQLASVIATSFPEQAFRRDKLGRHTHVATKTFQALRIFVNDEFNELQAALEAMHRLLRPGGLAVVISFHSLEDRIVKTYFHDLEINDVDDTNRGSNFGSGDRSISGAKSSIASKVKSEKYLKKGRLEPRISELSLVDLNRMVDRMKLEEVIMKRWRVDQKKVIVPADGEVALNARARSAKLRSAYKEG